MKAILASPEAQQVMVTLLIAVVNLLILVLGNLARKWAQAHVSQKNMDLAIDVADVVVGAVEQLADAGKIDYKRKMETAIQMARDQAMKWGLTFTDEQWEALLESAVKAMKDAGNEFKTEKVPAPA